MLTKLVKNLIENEQVPSILWANICWNKMDKIYLEKNILVPVLYAEQFGTSIDFPYDDHTNKQWFFIDMACKENSYFLSNIDEKYFAHPYRWIIADATRDSIGNLTILPGSNIILVNQEEHSNQYVLKQGNFFSIVSF